MIKPLGGFEQNQSTYTSFIGVRFLISNMFCCLRRCDGAVRTLGPLFDHGDDPRK